ncbi:hypothetical protein F5Y08DRAFT_304604 [Xylaria arbuscula]|nr:hypothetical protein F5Y08DRAFT_304604 [Xylaria arbuscula]
MDVSTASDSDSDLESISNKATPAPSANEDIHIKNIPACVVWRDSQGKSHSLPDLGFSLLYTPITQRALFRLQATTRLKKGPLKPFLYLFIKPDEISKLDYVKGESQSDRDEEELHGQARQKLNTTTHVLRFELRSAATFVVPNDHPFQFLRAGSQATYTSMMTFAKATRHFFIHFPMTTLSKVRLLSVCQAASTCGYLRPLDENISSLYGGKGGKVVDIHAVPENDVLQTREGIGSRESTGPPAYEACASAGPSLPAVAPPLCLSPNPNTQPSLKRRRRDSTDADSNDGVSCEKGNKADDRILQAILGLQQTMHEAKVAHEASLCKIMTRVEDIEGRFKQLEQDQRDLIEEIRTHMAPLWEEVDARFQSQEDREHVHIRDVVEEVVDESIKEKMTEAVDEYFKSDGEGHDLIHKAIGGKIQEEARDFLQSQCFVGNFTIKPERPPI